MNAYQTTLLPHLPPAEIKRLNHTPLAELLTAAPPVADELARVFAVSAPVLTDSDGRIHFVGDVLEVLLNLRRWQHELADPATRERWGRRTVTYFAAEPRTGRFAPSKFCAYVDIAAPTPGAAMTVARYTALDGREPRFDGHRARMHLTHHLGFSEGFWHLIPVPGHEQVLQVPIRSLKGLEALQYSNEGGRRGVGQ